MGGDFLLGAMTLEGKGGKEGGGEGGRQLDDSK